jgi:SAM-dependent methyltransferase
MAVRTTKEEIREKVRRRYAEFAARDRNCCQSSCESCGPSQDYVETIGYSKDDLGALPEGAGLALGCANPVALACLREGQTVLDLGSGAGLDALLAAKAVGEKGRVIGVDMTPEMIARARANAREAECSNVEFRLGEIEHLPVADDSVEVVISNCVVNLSPEKGKVFAEAYRVLKPGGRLLVSDIVLESPLPEEIKRDAEAYVGCIAGASLKQEYLDLIQAAGFREVEIVESRVLPWIEPSREELQQTEIGALLLERLGGDLGKAVRVAESVLSVSIAATK